MRDPLGGRHVRIQTKRIYDSPARSDGRRILIDRLWPRGLSKAAARIDFWAKTVATSTKLRRWYGQSQGSGKSSAVAILPSWTPILLALLSCAGGWALVRLRFCTDQRRRVSTMRRPFVSICK